MRPSNEKASIPESLPADLHAMLKLNEDALTSSWTHESHFYFIALMLGGFFFFIGWDSVGKSTTPAPVVYPFFALAFFSRSRSIGSPSVAPSAACN